MTTAASAPRAKARPAGARARWVRRGIWTMLLVALCAWFGWLVWQPFWHPQTQLVLLTGDIVTVDPLPDPVPADYVVEDFRALLALDSILDRGWLGARGPLVLGTLREPDSRSELADQLNDTSGGRRDVLLVYASAHGITQDGDAWLLAPGADPRFASQGRYRLRHLLAQLRECRAPVKLLLLDAGRIEYDPLRGLVENDFPELLAEQVEELEDPTLWVLCSHRSGEQSHLSSALRRTVFGYFVSEGLQGAADANGDRTISLAELAEHVTTGVAAWVKQTSGGTVQQTPFLVRGAGVSPLRGNPALSAVPPRTEAVAYRSDHLGAIAQSRVGQEVQDDASRELRQEMDQTIAESLARVTPRNTWGVQASSAIQQSLRKATGGKVGLPATGGKSASDKSAPDAAPAGEAPADPAAPGAEAGPAEAPPAKAASPDPAAASVPEAAASEPLPPVTELLAQAWELRDRLADSARPTIRPIDYAPFAWRMAEARLLALDRKHRTGYVRQEDELQRPLAELVTAFRQLDDEIPFAELPAESLAAQIASLRPGLRLPTGEARSLALLELAARTGGPAIPADLLPLLAQLDAILDGGNRADLEKFVASLTPDHERFIELRMARRVAASPETDWRLSLLLLAAARDGERAAAAGLNAPAWVQAAVDEADQLRRDAEQSWQSPLPPSRETMLAQLAQARQQYQQAIADMAIVLAAERQLHDILHRLPYYLAWHASSADPRSSGAPSTGALGELLGLVGGLSEALTAPGPESLVALRGIAPQLAASRAAVEQGLNPLTIQRLIDSPPAPSASWQIAQLLPTPLLAAADRAALAESAAGVESELVAQAASSGSPSPVSPTPGDQAYAERLFAPRAQLEHQLARAILAPIELPEWQRLDSAWSLLDGGTGGAVQREESLDEANREFAIALQDLYRNLPARIERELAASRDLSTAGTRSQHLSQLDRLQQAQRLVLPGAVLSAGAVYTAGPDFSAGPGQVEIPIAEARAYDLLAWHAARAERGTEDVTTSEAAFQQSVASSYRRAAEAIPHQPPLTAGRAEPLVLQGPRAVSLTYDPQVVAEFPLQFTGISGTKGWIVVEYDPALVEIVGRSPENVYRHHELGATNTDELIRKVARLRPSTTLVSGRVLPIRLQVTRLSAGLHSSPLIVRVVTESEVARFDVPIELPRPESIRLAVRGTAGTSAPSADGLALYPFPNRATSFVLQLASGTGAERNVDIELRPLTGPLASPLPTVTLAATDAALLRKTLQLGLPLAAVKGLVLPADGSLQDVVLAEPAPPPPPAAAEGAPAGAAGSGGAAPPAAPAAPPPPPQVDLGLLLVITDTADGSQIFKRLSIAPQRPQRYVVPRVRYSRARERIEIQVSPVDDSLLPAEGVRLSAELAETIAPDAERQLAALLRPGEPPAEMFVEVPAAAGRVANLRISVDGFPRAFLYRVPCTSDVADVPEDLEVLAVNLPPLPEGTIYQPPRDSLPVTVEIDAPAAALTTPPLLVEVGIDRNRDRELVGDEIVRITTDRQASVTWSGLPPTGELVVNTAVADHTVQVPALGLGSGRANVIARAALDDRVAWSAPLEIVFDRDAPRLSNLELQPAGRVAIGTDITVSALADDDGLSGIARLEALVDVDRTGQFGPDAKPVAGGALEDGRWAAKIPTAGLASGPYNVLLRAVDRAGNISKTARTNVRLITPEEAAAATLAASLADITGVVVYGDAPQAGIEMLLVQGEAPPQPAAAGAAPPASLAKAVTDAEGRFRFEKIPPGDYTVIAKGLVRNKNRTAQQVVKFALPKDLAELKLELP
ncbi:MAG: carboxypeptidase-like regulatory domain-containing protein [Pirellulaceae bacterium]|nr:carboxypeptidase-like regulatory domain-containing protein [Pirellulaceae bacterium]